MFLWWRLTHSKACGVVAVWKLQCNALDCTRGRGYKNLIVQWLRVIQCTKIRAHNEELTISQPPKQR